MTDGFRREIGGYFVTTPVFEVAVCPCRHRVPELRLIPTTRQASGLPIPCFIS
ncbi:hypothetical protein ACX80T_15640 [Arthrobacter sp. Sr33]|uniref:hypothetical protein n=1 Tax=Arthrobacter sp. TB 23 TaxID=494419 RepID=UPI0002EB95C1|nr:hypothetical protein [Arthrobacter sp. TB 23]